MKIIRDEKAFGIFMIPLLVDWNIKRCNQRGCRNRPNTIVRGAGEGIPMFGLCEEHFQMCNKENEVATINLEFDDFDAFDIGEITPATLEEVAEIERQFDESSPSPTELLAMPKEQRDKIMREQFESASNENFEEFNR